jgi:hydrogenase maturation protease
VSRVVIFGYGNPLRGDDAIGWLAAQQLQERLNRSDIQVIATHQLNPEHAELVAKAELALFMDASAEVPVGTISQTAIGPANSSARPSNHNLTPETLLACARDLYGACPKAVLFAVGAREFEYGELSREVAQALPLLVEEVTANLGK